MWKVAKAIYQIVSALSTASWAWGLPWAAVPAVIGGCIAWVKHLPAIDIAGIVLGVFALAYLFYVAFLVHKGATRAIPALPDGSPPKSGARGIVYGRNSRGGIDEDSQFHGFGDGDIPILDDGQGNRHVRARLFRKPEIKG